MYLERAATPSPVFSEYTITIGSRNAKLPNGVGVEDADRRLRLMSNHTSALYCLHPQVQEG